MRIHFTGIAGAGMSAVALMMRDAGHQVSGSDEDVFPPMSTYVAGLGFPVTYRFDAANLSADLDVLVLGTSAKLGGDDNVEVAAARGSVEKHLAQTQVTQPRRQLACIKGVGEKVLDRRKAIACRSGKAFQKRQLGVHQTQVGGKLGHGLGGGGGRWGVPELLQKSAAALIWQAL